jgi:ABC-2 type transport system permease protein
MATLAATAPRAVKTASPGIWLPAYSLWVREIVRFIGRRRGWRA